MVNFNKIINSFLFIAIVLSIIFRVYNINYDDLWFDEIATFWVTDPNISFSDFIERNNISEGSPYFYYFLIYFIHKIFGYDPEIGRYLSFFLGALSIFSSAYLCLLIKKNNSFKLSLFLLSFNVFLIIYSMELRLYMLLFFLSSLTLIFFIKYFEDLKNNKDSNLILLFLAISQILNSFTHPFSIIIFFSISLFLLINYLKYKIIYKKLIYSLIITFFLIFLFTFYFYIINENFSDYNWVIQPGIKFYTNFYFSKFFGSRLLGVIYLILLFYLIIKFRKIVFDFNGSISFLFCMIILSYSLPLIFGLYKPIILGRYIIFVLIPIILLISNLIFEIKNKSLKNAFIAMLVLSTSLNQLTETNVKQFFSERNHYKPEYKKTMNYLNKSNTKNYSVLVNFSSYNKKDIKEKAYLNYLSILSKNENLNLRPIKFEEINKKKITNLWILCSKLVNKNCAISNEDLDIEYTVLDRKKFINLDAILISLSN